MSLASSTVVMVNEKSVGYFFEYCFIIFIFKVSFR